MLLRHPARTIPSGAPVPDDTEAGIYLHVDDSLFATVVADGGWFELQTNGNPGPFYLKLTASGETHIASSKATGLSGPTQISILPELFKVWTDGFIDNAMNELAVSASGLGMTVLVATGIAVAQGIVYDQWTPVSLSIAPAHATLPRIDRVVVEVVPAGAGEDIEGRARLVVLNGVPNSVPLAPTVTQTPTLWQIPLATVRVDAAVSAIAANKVTDQRTVSGITLQNGAVTTAKLADGAVTPAKLSQVYLTAVPDGSVTNAKLAANAANAAKMSSDANRSTAAVALVLTAATGSATPVWTSLATTELADWSEVVPSTGQYPRWDGTKWTPATLPASSTSRQIQYTDQNFGAVGLVSGTVNLGTSTVQLDPGEWYVESFIHMTARGTPDTGTFTLKLIGNATPQGADQSARIFQTVGGVPREVVLTGRRIVTSTSSATLWTATAQVVHTSGSYSDIRDGIVYIVATPR